MSTPSGGSSSTQNQQMPWSQYVPPETYATYKAVLPKVAAKSDVGLTPEEKAYYTGQGITDVGASYSGAKKDLGEALARSGARGGAATEAYSDLARSKVLGTAGFQSSLTGIDIQKKGENTDRLLKTIALPGAPITTGSTTTYSPQKGGS